MRTQRIEERFAFTGGTVDRTGTYPVIRGALLCGNVSANGRDYPARAFGGERIKRYEGKSAFLNHASKPGQARDVRDKVAWIENARHRADGMPIGDIGFNPKHPDAESVLWYAEHKPSALGLSHVAHCRYEHKNGRDVVEEIIGVESVDIVVDPATTHGFFEQERKAVAKIKLTAFAEWVAKHPKSTSVQCIQAKRLAEEYGESEMDSPEDGMEPSSAIDDAFRALLHAHVDELLDDSQTVDDFMKKVKALHKAHKGKSEEGGEKEGGEKKEEPAEKKEEEGRQVASIGYDKAIQLCAESKYNATPSEYKLLAKCENIEEAKSFIAEQSGRVVESKPRSMGRTVATPPKAEPVQESRLIPAWNRVPSKN